MEIKVYRCKHCGNIAIKVINSGVPMSCCGEAMEELVPGSVDAAVEKHVPVVTRDGDKVTVSVGSVAHPMTAEHYIQFVILDTTAGVQIASLNPSSILMMILLLYSQCFQVLKLRKHTLTATSTVSG